MNTAAPNRVRIGGTVRIMGGRTESFLHRITSWFREDPEHAKYMLVGEERPERRQDLLDLMVRKGITTDLIPILESLHNDICRLYVRRISSYVLDSGELTPKIDIAKPGVVAGGHAQWVRGRYNSRAHALRFWITNCAKVGENYRDASWLLKNMRFDGWTPNQKNSEDCGANPYTEFKGFCRLEPVARFRQLMTFPIEKFGVDLGALPQIDWPRPPESVTGATHDVVADAESLRGDLQRWEDYYRQLVSKLQEFQVAVDAC